MAAAVIVAGPVLVRTGTGSASALEDLGYSANGVQIIEETRELPVPGDENGGDEGNPIDIQYFHERHIIRMELTKFDSAVAAKIGCKFKGDTAGTMGTIGRLFAAGSGIYRVLLSSTNVTRNYLACRPIHIEAVYGSKFTRLMIDFEALPSNGTLYNSTTSG